MNINCSNLLSVNQHHSREKQLPASTSSVKKKKTTLTGIQTRYLQYIKITANY